MTPDTVRVWKDRAREWRWTRYGRNGVKVGESTRHFASRRNARLAAIRSNPGCDVIAEPWRKGGPSTVYHAR